jgi:hypothetical protein
MTTAAEAEAAAALAEWKSRSAEVGRDRDPVVRAAADAGLNIRQIHLRTGIARSTIYSILGEAAARVHAAAQSAGPALAPVTHQYLHRPVLVASDLRMLQGPVTGVVTLPVTLHWSGDENAARFDLDDARQRLPLYVTVLREARQAADLGNWLDGYLLVALWPRLVNRLPKTVRQAWEQQHAVLRGAGESGLRAAS